MKTYLLQWNPDNWSEENFLKGDLDFFRRHGFKVRSWYCRTQEINLGDRVMLAKVGAKTPRGIFASGTVISEPYQDDPYHQKGGDLMNYVLIRFDKHSDPSKLIIDKKTLARISSLPLGLALDRN